MRARPKAIRALLIAGIAVCAIAPLADIWTIPAAAQVISLAAEFHTALEPYGAWQPHRRWGEVWIPSNVARDWQPYTVGHWVYSQEYGWYWVPDEPETDWGVLTYHYGRWAFEDQFGWMWIPGTEWGPGWVQWRHGGQHVGWAPLPPDDVIDEYRESPQFWVFVRERDLVAPRITEVILPPQEREVFFRDTAIVNRTVELPDRRFGVNPGIPPTYIAGAYGRPIPSHEISPRVFAGTANLPGAVVVRADDFRGRARIHWIAREYTHVRQTTNTVAPAQELPPLQPLGVNERGRLGALPPRAAQPGFAAIGQNRLERSGAPVMTGVEHSAGQSQSRPGGTPVPSTSGAAPHSGERELRNRSAQGAASPQEPRGRERSGVESQSPRNQGLEGQHGATRRPSLSAPSQSLMAQGRGSFLSIEAPSSHASATPRQRSQSPATTGAAPGGGRALAGGGHLEEQ